jgi:hypothetical protein
MQIRFLFFSSLLLAFSLVSGVTRADTLTYPDLVSRLTDMEHLATVPPPGEKTALASSYDRKSQYDAANDKYIEWGANGDGRGYIRDEGDTQVLADIQGTGCIWRLWSAAPDNGHLKIYLDGSTTPVLDMPFIKYFDEKDGPFPYHNLTNLRANEGVPGSLTYVPIPFSKSCKIVGDKEKPGQPGSGWGQYFQATYTLFAPGTEVKSFALPMSDEDKAALAAASAKVSNAGQNPMTHAGEKTESHELTIKPGQKTATELTGSGAITALKVKLDLPKDSEAQHNLLRQLTISITWDGEDKPAIWAPLGDFFATVGGSEPFSSIPAGLLDDGTLYSYWYMPFGKGAKIEIGNDGDAPVSATLSVSQAPLDKPADQLMRLHAKWHRDAFNPTRPDRQPDWTMVTTQGTGRFVGVLLHVWFPNGGWWGEGDDKFFVDGEKFPSSFGTGSEDYFGYAWSSGNRFVRPQYGQPLAEGNMGHEVDYRWHISDQVPFQNSLDADIENYNPTSPPADNPYGSYAIYACTPFWYLKAGETDNYEPQPLAQRIGYWIRPPVSFVEPGVIEGEDLKPVTPPLYQHYVGMAYLAPSMPKTWSNDRILAWTIDHGPDPVNGEHMELKVPVEKAGKYQIMARFAKAPNGGTYQLSLDGQKIGQPIDLYSGDEHKMIALDPMSLGTFDLKAGDHVLQVLAASKNPALADRRDLFFGLDYLKLVPAP